MSSTFPELYSAGAIDGVPELLALDEAEIFSAASEWVLSRRRRVCDAAAAALALLLLWPVMVCCAVLVAASSPGPVLFRQRRMGRNGKTFVLFKFRSMADAGEDGPAITVSGDARVTAVGALLRRYKLDELPQFWNVLRGDMGLVGPRPKLPQHEALRMPYRPGITGAATLSFRAEEEMLAEIPAERLDDYYDQVVKPCKARLDGDYMGQATAASDVLLLWRTAMSCVGGGRQESERVPDLSAEWAP